MSQGKAFTKEEREKIISEVLKPYFLLGQPIHRACQNAQVSKSAIYEWLEEDEVLRKKVESWQNYKYSKAEEVLIESVVKDKNTESAKFILKTGLRSEYGDKIENTNIDINEKVDENKIKRIRLALEKLRGEDGEDQDGV